MRKHDFFIVGMLSFICQLYSQDMYKKVELKTLNESAVSIDTKLASLVGLNSLNTFEKTTLPVLIDELGFEHSRMQQYFRGIKVEDAILILHKKGENIVSTNGAFLQNFTGDVVPSITEEQAFENALLNIGAKNYIWQNSSQDKIFGKGFSKPKGELVIFQNLDSPNKDFVLAYKYDIYATNPLSRCYIYVDAHNGSILSKRSLINDCSHKDIITPLFMPKNSFLAVGSAQTRYSGIRSIQTTSFNGYYILADQTRGFGIETLRYPGTPITNNTNNWFQSSWGSYNANSAGLDAHWGAERTFDYFYYKHNRNSFNASAGKIISYISNNTYGGLNAFWDGSYLNYGSGDGTNFFNPITSIDVVAHEFGHALCQYSANLAYVNESGALNESFSDIWGACVEYFADPTKQTWLIGEETQKVFRSMSNPNAYGQPDTYMGAYWYTGVQDHGGVHTNSGVQNFWFYLLSVGGSGINDHGSSFDVEGIGIEKAAKIVYRTETVYLGPNSKYEDAKNYSILAARDLFGPNSPESYMVEKAWCAVGLGGNCSACQADMVIYLPVVESKNYEASNEIIVVAPIHDNLAVTFKAPRVKLGQNFKVKGTVGSSFRAYSGSCSVTNKLEIGEFEENLNIVSEKDKMMQTDENVVEFKVIPNPNKGSFTLHFENYEDNNVEIFNITGQKIFEKKFEKLIEVDINLDKVDVGVYLIRTTSGNVSKVLKMIVE